MSRNMSTPPSDGDIPFDHSPGTGARTSKRDHETDSHSLDRLEEHVLDLEIALADAKQGLDKAVEHLRQIHHAWSASLEALRTAVNESARPETGPARQEPRGGDSMG